MQRLPFQLSVTALLIVVAGVALNLWLFRFGTLAGLLGLSVTKHVVIAWLCQVLGVDRRPRTTSDQADELHPDRFPNIPGPPGHLAVSVSITHRADSRVV